MSLTEREEDRLLNGKAYVNLPEHYHEKIDGQTHPEEGMERLRFARKKLPQPDPVPYVAVGAPLDTIDSAESAAQKKLSNIHHRQQQVEAQNRWQELETQSPAKNIAARNRKMALQVDKSHPWTFYKHEGKYNRERAGLYRTSFDPHVLRHSMNADEESGATLFNTLESHKNVLNLPLNLNNEMAELMWKGRTLGSAGSVPQLSDHYAPHEVLGPFEKLRAIQKNYLLPTFERADTKTQEDGTILLGTTYADGYSIPKFLQEYDLPVNVRKEPFLVMSKKNQILENARKIATPKVARLHRGTEDVSSLLQPEISNGLPNQSNTVARHGDATERNTVAFSFPDELPMKKQTASTNRANLLLNKLAMSDDPDLKKKRAQLYPGTNHVDMTMKDDDERFDWSPGSGKPRPQSNLARIQDCFTKTDAQRRFHKRFPEQNPDLRDNIIHGRGHEFYANMNAQVLRGARLTQEVATI